MGSEPQAQQQQLFDVAPAPPPADPDGLHAALRAFREFGTETICTHTLAGGVSIPTYVNEFWTSKQRAANSLHEVSYRACFKPQLPRFFVDRLTEPGDVVHDPFLGRGTTMLEAALAGRRAVGCDLNPLSEVLALPRLAPPTVEEVAARLASIRFGFEGQLDDDLLVFFHESTLRQILALKCYLVARRDAGELDAVDAWIRMVAVNRLTGHSPGFFSVYTMPPNQAVSVTAQRKINTRRSQRPEPRDVPALILRKTKSLLSGVDDETRARVGEHEARVFVTSSSHTPGIGDATVRLVVTSPPFLDVVQYKDDNWLRCWFCDIDVSDVVLSTQRRIDEWQAAMTETFRELPRVLQPGGYVAFEVGEVRGGTLRLEEVVVPCGLAAGLEPVLLLINDQKFTKTANCWGVSNNRKGTNTNRVVTFRRPA